MIRPVVRQMPDGTPCWCVSTAAPHEGWIHAPACEERRALFPDHGPDPDPLRPAGTDIDYPTGAVVVFAFAAWIAVLAFIIGLIVGRLTA